MNEASLKQRLRAELQARSNRGERHMRPRKGESCHVLAPAYAVQGLRKAEIVTAWAETAIAAGADTMRGPGAMLAGRRQGMGNGPGPCRWAGNAETSINTW